MKKLSIGVRKTLTCICNSTGCTLFPLQTCMMFPHTNKSFTFSLNYHWQFERFGTNWTEEVQRPPPGEKSRVSSYVLSFFWQIHSVSTHTFWQSCDTSTGQNLGKHWFTWNLWNLSVVIKGQKIFSFLDLAHSRVCSRVIPIWVSWLF